MRGSGSFRYQRPSEMITLTDRLISAFSYPTSGLVGFIWLIISHVKGHTVKPFVKYHTFQSIFLSIILYLFSILIGIMLAFIKFIPFLGNLIINSYYGITRYPAIAEYSIAHFALILFVLYLFITAFIGRYSFIPLVSKIVKDLIRY